MGCSTDIYDARLPIEGHEHALFDLAYWKNGLAFRKIDFSPTGQPVIKIAELNNGISDTTSYAEGDYGSDVHLTRGDLVFSWSGNPETSIDIYRYDLPDGWLNQHIFKVVPYETMVTKDYFYYLMKLLKPVFKAIAINKQTTGLGHVTIADLKHIRVTVPSIDMQVRQVFLLSELDSQIVLNNRTNGYLAELARQLYARLQVDNASISKVGAIAAINPEIYSPKERWNHVSYLDTRSLADNIFSELQSISPNEEKLPSRARRKVKDGDVLFSTVRPNQCHFGIVNSLPLDTLVSTAFTVIRTSPDLSPLIYLALTEQNVLKSLQQLAETSTSTIPSVKPSDLAEVSVAIPTNGYDSKLLQQIGSCFKTIGACNRESVSLASLRDALLPKLMSGEIDVSKVEQPA